MCAFVCVVVDRKYNCIKYENALIIQRNRSMSNYRSTAKF